MTPNAHTAHPLMDLVVQLCMQAHRSVAMHSRACEALVVLPMPMAQKLEQATGHCLARIKPFGMHLRYDGTDPCPYVLLFAPPNPVAVKQHYLYIDPLRQLLAEANIHTE